MRLLLNASMVVISSAPRRIRLAAARTLPRFGHSAGDSLSELLQDSDPGVRWCAADGLARLAPKSSDIAVCLTRRLRDEDRRVRRRCLEALAAMGPAAAPAADALLKLLSDPDAGNRRRAAAALGAIGPQARPALRKLQSLSKREKNRHVAQVADRAAAAIQN